MSATSSFYVGPRQGRWTPGTMDELKQAIGSGILNETTWVELKRGLAPNQPGGVETARDLASLALRSGLLVVGVDEASRGVAGEITSVDLAAARDRIDQIARNVPSPPIYVETREIADPDAPGRGVLLVGVPASGPHMVDGRYWGRGDTGKTPLTDPEVREFLARRRLAAVDVLEQVRDLSRSLNRDWHPEVMEPRLYVRIVPEISRQDALLPLLEAPNGQQQLRDLLKAIMQRRPGPAEEPLASAFMWAPYAHGRALTSEDLTLPPDQNLTMLRLEDTGAVDLIHGPVGGHSSQGLSDPVTTVHVHTILAAVHDTLGLVGQLADRYAVNPGTWIAAIRIDFLEGRRDWWAVKNGYSHFPAPYTGRPDYEDTVVATTGELVEEPWAVTERVLARLVRALGAQGRYLPYEPGSQAIALRAG